MNLNLVLNRKQTQIDNYYKKEYNYFIKKRGMNI